MVVSSHAVDRWIGRVDPGVNRLQARASIGAMAERGRVCAEAPKWARDAGVRNRNGQVVIAWHERPGILLVVVNDTVTTVFTKGSGELHRHRRRVARKMDQTSHKPGRRVRQARLEVRAAEAWGDDG